MLHSALFYYYTIRFVWLALLEKPYYVRNIGPVILLSAMTYRGGLETNYERQFKPLSSLASKKLRLARSNNSKAVVYNAKKTL